MEFFRLIMACALSFLLALPTAHDLSGKSVRKGKKPKTETVAKSDDSLKTDLEFKKYSDIIKKDTKTCRGLVSFHLLGNGKLYMEIPDSVLGKEMLLTGRVSGISNNIDVIAGEMPNMPVMIRWESDKRNIYARAVYQLMRCNDDESISMGVERNNIAPIMEAFPIIAMTPDSTASVIDVTSFFLSDRIPFTPLVPNSGIGSLFGLRDNMEGQFDKQYGRPVRKRQVFNSFSTGIPSECSRQDHGNLHGQQKTVFRRNDHIDDQAFRQADDAEAQT